MWNHKDGKTITPENGLCKYWLKILYGTCMCDRKVAPKNRRNLGQHVIYLNHMCPQVVLNFTLQSAPRNGYDHIIVHSTILSDY